MGANFRINAGKLDTLSPLAVLSRGYAVATRDNTLIRHASDVSCGESISIRLARGSLDCKVEKIKDE